MSVVIKIENVSKQYRLGLIGTRTLKGDLQRWWYNMRGLPDPTLKIGQENRLGTKVKDLSTSGSSTSGDFVWALKDINFEVKQGEVFGIIGKNGAGKSTLLKLLSRVTAPTTGNIKVKGRIASLLEVGTGFHPELTGRENIFLNGAILGMTKIEIYSKLDEIVDFAGIATYIDTPVKRYSSGMYVRLAFAVAAHLEPEILIVDEVLAVGDAEFQKKALGKMQDVSHKEGRTVLFVSHNMGAVKSLCNKGMLLVNGSVSFIGDDIDSVVGKYVDTTISLNAGIPLRMRTDRTGTGNIFIKDFNFSTSKNNTILELGKPITLLLQYSSRLKEFRGKFLISINTFDNQCILFLDSSITDDFPSSLKSEGLIKISLSNDFTLPVGRYFINIAAYVDEILADYIQYAVVFDVVDGLFFKLGKKPIGKSLCYIKQTWGIV